MDVLGNGIEREIITPSRVDSRPDKRGARAQAIVERVRIGELGFIDRRAVELFDRAAKGLRTVASNKNVVHQAGVGGRSCCHESAASRAMIHEGIVREMQLIRRPFSDTFGPVGDQGAVLGVRTLLDQIADDVRQAAFR